MDPGTAINSYICQILMTELPAGHDRGLATWRLVFKPFHGLGQPLQLAVNGNRRPRDALSVVSGAILAGTSIDGRLRVQHRLGMAGGTDGALGRVLVVGVWLAASACGSFLDVQVPTSPLAVQQATVPWFDHRTLVRLTSENAGQQYGVGYVIQLHAFRAGLLLNVRTAGQGHWDFENGVDFRAFSHPRELQTAVATVVTRNPVETTDHGTTWVGVTYPLQPGFVPMDALAAAGTAHPAAATGFGISQVRYVELGEAGSFNPTLPAQTVFELLQLRFTGADLVTAERAVWQDVVAGQDWDITGRGISAAIPDGVDLLLPIVGGAGGRTQAGVSRWQWDGVRWLPVAFTAIAVGTEPSLIRDGDGCLLFTARGGGNEVAMLTVWRSCTAAAGWELKMAQDGIRSDAPVSINLTADGLPYLASNPHVGWRSRLALWPLGGARNEVGEPMVVMDALREFGAPPLNTNWFADHPISNVVRLGDGAWHHLLVYRVMAFRASLGGKEEATPHTGTQVDEIASVRPTRPVWLFDR